MEGKQEKRHVAQFDTKKQPLRYHSAAASTSLHDASLCPGQSLSNRFQTGPDQQYASGTNRSAL